MQAIVDLANIKIILPEIILLVTACLLILATAFAKDQKSPITYVLAQLGFLAAFWAVLCNMVLPGEVVFHGAFVGDALAHFLKAFSLAVCFLVTIYGREYVAERNIPLGEFYILLMFSVLGVCVLISAGNLLLLYLGLELLSLPLYAMVALRHDSGRAAEAATKYFVMGALASGILLYGISMIYGATGSIVLVEINRISAQAAQSSHLILSFGVVFLVVGMAFKLGAVPFHMWVPDVYDGAPTAVTTVLSSVPKIAAFAMVVRLLHDMVPALQADWAQMWWLLAVTSIALGNVVAIAQTSLKRMLAYSSIAHVGYLGLAIMVGNNDAFSAATFYIVTYALTSAAAFGLLSLLSRRGMELEKIEDLRGLNDRNPWLAFLMMMVMFSMAGIPPTVGFIAKLNIFRVVIASGHIVLAIYAILFAVVGCFYYLRVIKTLYFEAPAASSAIVIAWDARVVLSVNGLALLALGIFPAALLQATQAVF